MFVVQPPRASKVGARRPSAAYHEAADEHAPLVKANILQTIHDLRAQVDVKALQKAIADNDRGRAEQIVGTPRLQTVDRESVLTLIRSVMKSHGDRAAQWLMNAVQPVDIKKFSEDQARDDHGRWTANGGASPLEEGTHGFHGDMEKAVASARNQEKQWQQQKLKREQLVALDANGNPVAFFKGSNNRVEMTATEGEKLRGAAVVTHWHPDVFDGFYGKSIAGGTLSWQDIAAASFKNVGQIRAASSDTTYAMTFPNGWPTDDALQDLELQQDRAQGSAISMSSLSDKLDAINSKWAAETGVQYSHNA